MTTVRRSLLTIAASIQLLDAGRPHGTCTEGDGGDIGRMRNGSI